MLQFPNNICETINNYGKGKLCAEKKYMHTICIIHTIWSMNLILSEDQCLWLQKYGYWAHSNYWESSEGDSVTSKFSSFSSMIWYCPIKYNHWHIKSLCLHQKHSSLATELLRVQRGLNSQGEEKAGAISNLVISDLDSHANADNTTLENCTWWPECSKISFLCVSFSHLSLLLSPPPPTNVIRYYTLFSFSFNMAHEGVAFN